MVSITDITAVVGMVTGSAGLALIIYKTLKEKPKLKIEILEANWFKRTEHSIVTTFGIYVRIHNKGDRNTTVHSAILEIEQEGKKFSIETDRLDVIVTSSSSALKQLLFNLSLDQAVISDNITNSMLLLKHTHGTEKAEVPLIKKPSS